MTNETYLNEVADILLEMVLYHCPQKLSGHYDSNHIGVNAKAIRCLVGLGKMRMVNDDSLMCIRARIR